MGTERELSRNWVTHPVNSRIAGVAAVYDKLHLWCSSAVTVGVLGRIFIMEMAINLLLSSKKKPWPAFDLIKAGL
jgi:hypothetical protein